MIHTIPVPQGWSVEQAWEAVVRGDLLPDDEKTWANVETDDCDHFIRIIRVKTTER